MKIYYQKFPILLITKTLIVITALLFSLTVKAQYISKLITKAEMDFNIPRGLLLAIAKHESSLNPYALNISGTSYRLNSVEQTKKVILNNLNKGITNIDIGVMQINYRWHKNSISFNDMLDTRKNIYYGAKYLRSLYNTHKSWHLATKYYHSCDTLKQNKYSLSILLAWKN